MSILTAPARVRTSKPTARQLAAMYLKDRDANPAGLDDFSLLTPADRASVARIMGEPATVEVKGAAYTVEPLASPAGPAFRLTSPRGAVYDIEDTANGSTCDCPDYVCRRAGLDSAGCKHIRALVREGLIANACTAPVVPTYSADADVDAAIGSGVACLFPASLNYRTNMAMLADMADRSAAVRADLDALRSAPLDPVEARHAVEAEPGNDGASTADAWPAWTDDFRWELGAGEDDDEGGSEFEGWATNAPPSTADPAAVAAAFRDAWLADLADPRSHLYAAKFPARPAADAKPIRVRTPRRTNVGSEYRDEDQLRNHGAV